MATLQIFAKEMNQLATNVQSNIPKLQRKVAQTVVDSVAMETPVLTGQAAANWKTQIGSPNTGYDWGPNANAGQHSIDEARAALASLAMGHVVYISNNLPYILELNNGYSSKAPAGFVEIAIVDALHQSANFNLLIK